MKILKEHIGNFRAFNIANILKLIVTLIKLILILDTFRFIIQCNNFWKL